MKKEVLWKKFISRTGALLLFSVAQYDSLLDGGKVV